jgi:hypothetical protein
VPDRQFLCRYAISFVTRYSKIRKIPYENRYTPTEYAFRLVAGGKTEGTIENVAYTISCSKMTCLVHPRKKWRVLHTRLQNGVSCIPCYKMACLVHPVTKLRFLHTLLKNNVSCTPCYKMACLVYYFTKYAFYVLLQNNKNYFLGNYVNINNLTV